MCSPKGSWAGIFIWGLELAFWFGRTFVTHLEQLLTPHHSLGGAFGATHSFDVSSEEGVWRTLHAEVPQLKCLAVIRS